MQNQNSNKSNDTVKALLLVIAALLFLNAVGGITAVREWLLTQEYIKAPEANKSVTVVPNVWPSGANVCGTPLPDRPDYAVCYNTPAPGNLVIQEQPAVIVATGAPPTYEQPSVPVVEPAPVATAVPTHAPLPGSMAEAADMGYWAMPITPQQYEWCVADPSINPACQFYVKE